MTDARFSLPSQAELLQRNGTLLVIDQIQPPPGLVAKGQTPALKPKEQGLFIAICDSGEVYAFNGHVNLGTGVRTALGRLSPKNCICGWSRSAWCWVTPKARQTRERP